MIQFKYKELEKFYEQFNFFNTYYGKRSPRGNRLLRIITMPTSFILIVVPILLKNKVAWFIWVPLIILGLLVYSVSLWLNTKAAKELTKDYPSSRFKIWYLVDQYVTVKMKTDLDLLISLREDFLRMSASSKYRFFTWGNFLGLLALIVTVAAIYIGAAKDRDSASEVFQLLLLLVSSAIVFAIGLKRPIEDIINTKSERYHTIAMILGEIKNNKEYLRQKRLFEGRPHNSNEA